MMISTRGPTRRYEVYEPPAQGGRRHKVAGTLEYEYLGVTGIPGYVGHAPGRFMFRFLAENERHPCHGRYYGRLSEAKADLAPLWVSPPQAC